MLLSHSISAAAFGNSATARSYARPDGIRDGTAVIVDQDGDVVMLCRLVAGEMNLLHAGGIERRHDLQRIGAVITY